MERGDTALVVGKSIGEKRKAELLLTAIAKITVLLSRGDLKEARTEIEALRCTSEGALLLSAGAKRLQLL